MSEAELRPHSEPSAGEREGPAPRMEEPSAGEREGPAPRLEEPASKRRRRHAPVGVAVDRQGQNGAEVDPGHFGAPYPLDPPLVDVRIPVRAPHATATAYSRQGLMHRFPDAEVGDDLHILFREPSAGEREGPAPRKKEPSAGEREGPAPRKKEPGKPQQSRLSPDVFVALKVPRRSTRSDFDVDELGPPDFVLEVMSRSTWQHDIGRKLDAYQRIGVRECVLFDVTGENLAGTGKDLWGFALTPKSRKPLKERALPNGKRGVHSEVLGLIAYVAERTPPAVPKETWALTMRWHDPATMADIPDYDQSRAEAQAERTRADAVEHEARARAEADRHKIEELEEQIRRLREGR